MLPSALSNHAYFGSPQTKPLSEPLDHAHFSTLALQTDVRVISVSIPSIFYLSKSTYIKVTVCTCVAMSPFHTRTVRPISTKFCTDPANSGKVLNTSMTLPTQPLDLGVPQTLKPLCNVKCPDGRRKFFPGQCRGPVG